MATQSDKSTALWVTSVLHDAGHEALLAGGCVRDMLLGNEPHDYDVATSATPEQVQALFRRVLMVGAKFGVAIVLRGEMQIEVATFRADLEYSDGRRPDGVRFTSAKEDALRRDFTINGMFFDPVAESVVDYVGGQEDLRAGVLRTIGAPDERFGEDYLRLLRAVRFATRFGFEIEPQTERAMVAMAGRITGISGERIFDELAKMLRHGSAPQAIAMLIDSGLAEAILPEMTAHWPAAMQRIERLELREQDALNFASLLNDLEPKTIGSIIKRWGASNELKKALGWCATHRDDWQQVAGDDLAAMKRRLAHPHWSVLQAVWRLRETIATGSASASDALAGRIATIDPATIAPPALLDGHALMELGVPTGPALGKMMHDLYTAQLDETLLTRDDAVAWVQSRLAGA